MTRLTGYQAIEAAERDGDVRLCSYTDPTAEAREGITLDEAREIAREDPSLVYADVESARTTTRPVTVSGWYDHTDGTVGQYRWVDGRATLVRTVATWAHVPDASMALDDAEYLRERDARLRASR